jgi:hypothetical protein
MEAAMSFPELAHSAAHGMLRLFALIGAAAIAIMLMLASPVRPPRRSRRSRPAQFRSMKQARLI